MLRREHRSLRDCPPHSANSRSPSLEAEGKKVRRLNRSMAIPISDSGEEMRHNWVDRCSILAESALLYGTR